MPCAQGERPLGRDPRKPVNVPYHTNILLSTPCFEIPLLAPTQISKNLEKFGSYAPVTLMTGRSPDHRRVLVGARVYAGCP